MSVDNRRGQCLPPEDRQGVQQVNGESNESLTRKQQYEEEEIGDDGGGE